MIPAVFVFTVGTLAVARHLLLGSSAYDLGIKSQLLYNCAAGRWPESSFEVQHYFGDHFNPTFLLLVPIYALIPSPLTLVVLQAACVAAGGVLVGVLTARWLPDVPWAALLAQAVFLFHPSTCNLVLFDVHENAFAGTLVLAAVLMLEDRRWVAAAAFAVLAAGCKENGGLAVAALGTWLVLRHRRRLTGGALLGLGLAYSFLVLAVVMPHYRGETPDTLERYTHLGDTPVHMLLNVLRRPHLYAATILQGGKIVYVLVLLLPTLFVPFLRPAWLLPAVWVLLPNLLSSRPQQYSSLYQYDALAVPFVVLAMVRAWCELSAQGRLRLASRPIVGLTAAALIVGAGNSRLWHLDRYALANVGRVGRFKSVCERIPSDAPLSASLNVGPHLIRRQLLDYPNLDWPASKFPKLPARRAQYVLVDYIFEWHQRAAPRATLNADLIGQGYTLIAEVGDFGLYGIR